MEATAHHEAGHVFMAIYFGARVRSVTIEPNRDDGPQTCYNKGELKGPAVRTRKQGSGSEAQIRWGDAGGNRILT